MSTKSYTLCTLDQVYINKYPLCQLFLASLFFSSKIILLDFICTSLKILVQKKLFIGNHSVTSTQKQPGKIALKSFQSHF